MSKNKTHGTGFQFFISIPWCCVVSLIIIALSLVSSIIPLSGVRIFDEFFHHYLLIPTIFLHIFGIGWYLTKDHHKTTKKNSLYLVLSLLFVLSMLFHVSDLHDKIFSSASSHFNGQYTTHFFTK